MYSRYQNLVRNFLNLQDTNVPKIVHASFACTPETFSASQACTLHTPSQSAQAWVCRGHLPLSAQGHSEGHSHTDVYPSPL